MDHARERLRESSAHALFCASRSSRLAQRRDSADTRAAGRAPDLLRHPCVPRGLVL